MTFRNIARKLGLIDQVGLPRLVGCIGQGFGIIRLTTGHGGSAMTARLNFASFATVLAVVIAVPLGPALFGDRVLSPSDLAYAQRSFEREGEPSGFAFEPSNRLLTDPMLQFEPWIEFNRAEIRGGRLPLWNPLAGCGVPHLANGQSAVFDPFLVIAYIGSMPRAIAWMAAARLWVAGVGMYLLASCWGLGRWGRWFAGLAYPLGGFLALWLLYPLASVAAWLPWLIAATDGLVRRPGAGSMAAVAASSALVLLGGHVQTGAHCFMLAGLYLLFQVWSDTRVVKVVAVWTAAMGIGVATAAVTVVPLGAYLSRSPAWTDRVVEKGSPWTIAKPRLLEATTTALPNLLGSQRRGQPNLARALGANNQNESAAGFSGLGTLIWLAPVGIALGRGKVRPFLIATVALGAFASFRLPPIDNLLRALPVLDVTDHRRATLLIGFGLVGLGAIGLDRFTGWHSSRSWRLWIGCWAIGAAILAIGAAVIPRMEGAIRDRAMGHYADSASRSIGLDAADAAILADRQVRNLTKGYPISLLISATTLASLASLASWTAARPGDRGRIARPLVLGIVVVDLVASFWGANPTIARADYRPRSEVIEHLRREVPPFGRVLAIGAELPPNMLMRYGLADIRTYDAIELTAIVDWLAPLYDETSGEKPEARTSRRTITWEGVERARDRLLACQVAAVVGATAPPEGLFDRVARVGRVWVGHWDRPEEGPRILACRGGSILIESPETHQGTTQRSHERITIPVVHVPGWRARSDGEELPVSAGPGPFVSVDVPAGIRRFSLSYEPAVFRLAVGLSLSGAAGILALAILGSVKKGAKPLGSTRQSALESISMVPRGDPRGPAPQSEGYDADGPLHV